MKVFLWIILVVCILAAGVFGYFLFSELIVDMQSQSFFDNMVAGVETRPRNWERGSGVTGNPSIELEEADYEHEPWISFMDFDALNEQYPGVVGWIELEDSPINFPIMQHPSNNTFFLNHLPDGTVNRSGSIYLDYRNENDFSDYSIFIYGHHFSRTDAMFSYLRNYRNQEFFDNNPIIYIYTPYADYALVIFGAHLAHAFRDHPPLYFANDDEFYDYVRIVRGRSLVQTDVEVNAGDKIVSLVTCQQDFADARLIVTGKLVRLGGIDTPNTSVITS